MIRKVFIVAAAMVLTTAASHAQDATAGSATFRKLCTTCHEIGPTAKNKVGPVLNGIDGRKSGSIAGFNYSDANKSSGITWNEEVFLDYIKDPRAKIPNTKMVFVGIKAEGDARNLWAFLKQYDADGKTK